MSTAHKHSIADVDNTGCWYKGTAEHECGQPTVMGRNWCKDHVWLIYQEGTALRKRKKDQHRYDQKLMWLDLLNQAVEELEAEGFDLR